ncbi:HPr family phosphocarrier protein [candidate division WOR-3 bacterium]|nr:HPr family phosphocarrier protein [candidate division WOR-3 bacterium]
MLEKEMTIINTLGIHARPAAMIVKVAGKYKSTVVITKDGIEANGRSIMDILMLEAEKGSKINIIVDGEDERDVFDAVVELVNRGFDEE